MGILLNIATKTASGEPMTAHREIAISRERGLEGDFRGEINNRQVTVVSREAWETACGQLKADLPWTTRRANLLVEGLDLEETAGSRLRIGRVVLEITGETTPCKRMDAAYAGLREALTPQWRSGANCRVIEGGTVRAGDEVQMEAVASDA